MNSPSPSNDLREELRGDAHRVAGAASERLQGEADARKGAAVGQAKSLSSALDKVVGEMGDDTPDWLKSAFSQGAQSLDRLADTIDRQDSRELLANVSGFARGNPATFLAGCAALGFAAARVFKAGESDVRTARDAGQGGQPASQSPAAPLYEPSNMAAAADQDRRAVPLGADAAAPASHFQS